MDNENTESSVEDAEPSGVLILVLMDNENTVIFTSFQVLVGVLILVLMDNENTTLVVWLPWAFSCLNPCFNG